MTFASVLCIAALNCVALFFISFLATGGDGSSDGVLLVWRFGYSWVAVVTSLALLLCFKAKRSAALLTATLTLPAGFAVALATLLVSSQVSARRSNSPEFELACQGTGAQFQTKPTEAVTSIAYDWAPGTHPPEINYFLTDAHGNLSAMRGGLPTFPGSIRFIEGRCCQFEGAPTSGTGPYIRRANGGGRLRVAELSADAVITYRMTSIEQKDTQAFQRVEISVSDRRNGQTLGTLNYVLDYRRKRGCGATSDGVMDERGFILRAIGIDPR